MKHELKHLDLRQKRYWLYLFVIALLLYVLVPQASAFSKSLTIMYHAQARWVYTGVALALLTHLLAAWKYQLLALRPLRLGRMFIVQIASALANRLLPAGIGGMGVTFLYLRHEHHTNNQAGVLVAMNDLLGFVGHMLLLLLLVAVTPADMSSGLVRAHSTTLVYAMLGFCGLALIGLLFRGRISMMLVSTRTNLAVYLAHPTKLLGGFITSVLIALANAAIVYVAAQALHIHVSFVGVLLALTAGVALGSASPTPGGLIGVEAGMVAALVAYGVSAPAALAVTLLFRLLTFWFGLVIGAAAFAYVARNGLLRA